MLTSQNFLTKRVWLLTVILVLLGLGLLPNILGLVIAGPDKQYPQAFFNPLDTHTYFAKIEQGRLGDWFFRPVHSGETVTAGVFVFTFYIFLGKVAGLFNLDSAFTFHAARIIFGGLLLVVIYDFLGLFFSDEGKRRLAFLLCCGAAGVGWLAYPLGLINFIPESLSSEGFTFFQILSAPHFSVAVICLLLTLKYAIYALEGRGLKYYLWAALAGFGATFIHLFLMLTLAAVLGLYWLRLCYNARRMLWADFFGLLLIGLAGLPGPLITWLASSNVAWFADFSSQLVFQTQGVGEVLVTYGLLLPLAAWGGWWLAVHWPKLSPDQTTDLVKQRWELLPIWSIVGLVLLVSPLTFNKRLGEGLVIPLVCLSVLAWENALMSRLKKRKNRSRLRFGLFTVLTFSLVLVFLINLILVTTERSSYYYGVAEQGAFGWLQQNAQSGEVVLSGLWFSNVLPAQTKLKVRPFYGHPLETLNAKSKESLVKEFFNVATSQSRRTEIIRQNRLTYLVYYAPREKALGDFDPANGGWPVVYSQADLTIYKLS